MLKIRVGNSCAELFNRRGLYTKVSVIRKQRTSANRDPNLI